MKISLMKDIKAIEQSVFSIADEKDFNRIALAIFQYQFHHVEVYRQFCANLKRTNPSHYTEIPFLPISFFKTHSILSNEKKSVLTFKSSGTTLTTRSHHEIAVPQLYKRSFLATFKKQITNPKESIILALLPNYIEQGNSSLVYMVDFLIRQSQHPLSGFYLSIKEELKEVIQVAKQEKKPIVLFGVTYALLDLAEEKVDLSGVKIIETGGMKGRRKEMIRSELHEILKLGLNVEKIYSEYGMTELLSQAYTEGGEWFNVPPWMKILIRDINDPLQILLRENKTGGVNVIDLANIYSCSFIATDDLGTKKNQQFKVLGRFDNSDIRGCNLLVS